MAGDSGSWISPRVGAGRFRPNGTSSVNDYLVDLNVDSFGDLVVSLAPSATVGLDTNYDLTTDPTNFYIGTAPLASTDTGPWTIRRITFAAGSPTQSRFASGAWSQRASLAYT